MRCSYSCNSAEHVLSRRRFLGGMAAAGVGAGFAGLIAPTVSADLARRQRQVLVIWLAGGASQLETWDPKPKTDTGGPFRSIETSVPGVFAIGDVRCGSVKRVGGAIGEGAVVVAELHAYLADLEERERAGSGARAAAH